MANEYKLICLIECDKTTFSILVPRTADVDELRELIYQKRQKRLFRDIDPADLTLFKVKIGFETLRCDVSELTLKDISHKIKLIDAGQHIAQLWEVQPAPRRIHIFVQVQTSDSRPLEHLNPSTTLAPTSPIEISNEPHAKLKQEVRACTPVPLHIPIFPSPPRSPPTLTQPGLDVPGHLESRNPSPMTPISTTDESDSDTDTNRVIPGPQPGPSHEEAAVRPRPRRTRKANILNLNACICGISITDREIQDRKVVMKCRAPGCETVWFHLRCLDYYFVPRQWSCDSCKAGGNRRRR